MPHLKHQDARLHEVLKSVDRVVAADGSLFAICAQAAWALRRTDRAGKDDGQVRLNLQLDVLSGLPEGPVSASGQADGSESGAFAKLIAPGGLYVSDRNFVDFAFVRAVLDAPAHLLLRLKSDTTFRPDRPLPLTAGDVAAGVVSDAIGYLGVEGGTGPTVRVREVVVIDPRTGDRVRLLTTLTDAGWVPAHVVGLLLYRYRWQVELFFRWLKCWADWEHLICQSENGVRLHFYVALIGVRLTYGRTGRRLSKYAYHCLCWVPVLAALDARLRGWVYAGLSVAYAVPLTLAFVAARWHQKRQIESRRGSGDVLDRRSGPPPRPVCLAGVRDRRVAVRPDRGAALLVGVADEGCGARRKEAMGRRLCRLGNRRDARVHFGRVLARHEGGGDAFSGRAMAANPLG